VFLNKSNFSSAIFLPFIPILLHKILFSFQYIIALVIASVLPGSTSIPDLPSSTNSGITIPANQTFLLGELNDENYSVELKNKSNLIISIKVINKKSNQIVEKFDLEPQVKKVMQISKKEIVHFINNSDRDVIVDAILSDGVLGRRYITNN